MTTRITVCDTCRRRDLNPLAEPRDGARFAARVEAAAQDAGDVTVARHSCFIHCATACNVEVHADGKLTYILGKFHPEDQDPAPLLAFARLHAASATGNVPFQAWPEGLQEHFIERRPPLAQTSLIR